MKRLYLPVALILLTACQFHVIRHDEDRAARESAEVLAPEYIAGDYRAAHLRLHPDLRPRVSPDQLAQLATQVTMSLGVVTELRLDSFLPMPGQRAITIFFNGVNERDQSFHRIMLLGDASGYKVAGLFVQPAPYADEKLRQRFSQRLVFARQTA